MSEYQYGLTFQPHQLSHNNPTNILTLLLKDFFPYFTAKSITTVLLVLQGIVFLIHWDEFSILPNHKTYVKKNIFSQLISILTWLIIVTRLCSQYESKLGLKPFFILLIIAQSLRLILKYTIYSPLSSLIINTSSPLSLYVLSLFNLQTCKENSIIQFTSQQRIENYDLLDLNDTIIKLKNNESCHNYQSFTNREFYYYNMGEKGSGRVRGGKKGGKKIKHKKMMESILNEQVEESEEYEIKIYKLVVYNFLVFSLYRTEEFLVFLVTEIIIYLRLKLNLSQKIYLS